MDTDPTDLVRSGYNAVSRHYRGDDDTIEEYDRWLVTCWRVFPSAGTSRRPDPWSSAASLEGAATGRCGQPVSAGFGLDHDRHAVVGAEWVCAAGE
jgi:hypothetical protein